MGFYSFYKIIKDLLRTFFGSKMMKITIALIIALLLCSYIMPVFATSEVLYPINHSSETLDIATLVDSGVYYFMYITKISRTYTFQVVRCDKPFTFENASSPSQYNAGSFKASQNCNFSTASGETSYGSLSGYINNTTLSSTATIGQSLATFSPFNYTGANSISYNDVVYSCNFDIKDENGDVKFGNTIFNPPHFDNTSTDLQNVSFQWLYIDPSDYGIENNLYLHLLTVNRTIEINQNETAYYYDDTSFKLNKNSKYLQYFSDNESYPYYSIPKHKLSLDMNTQYFFVLSSSGSSITSSVGVITDSYDDTIFQVVSVNTSGVITQADVNSDNLQNIDDALNTGDDDNLSESDLQLPTMNIQDPSSSGFLGFFTILYNGFCSGEPTSLVIQLPFIDKTVTIDPNLTYNIFTKQEWLPLYALLQAFYWFVISRYIMISVRDIILHIKNIDFDVKNLKDSFASDIRRDML